MIDVEKLACVCVCVCVCEMSHSLWTHSAVASSYLSFCSYLLKFICPTLQILINTVGAILYAFSITYL